MVGVARAVKVDYLGMGGPAINPVEGFDAVGDHWDDAGANDAVEHELVEVGGQDRVNAPGADKLTQAEMCPVDSRRCFGCSAHDLPLFARIREVPLEQLTVDGGPFDSGIEILVFLQPDQCIVALVEVALPIAVVVGKLDCALPGDFLAERHAGRFGAAGTDEKRDAAPFDVALVSTSPLDGLDDLADLADSGLARSAQPRL